VSPPHEMEVRVHGVTVGRLVRHGGGVRFEPHTDWLAAGQHPPLGLAFLQEPRPPVLQGLLPAWFENLLPERRSPLRSWVCQHYGLRETDSVGILARLGRDLPGAVEVTGSLEGVAEAPDQLAPPEGQLRFSLAGLQLKLSMVLSGERFSFPARGQSGRWIVKLPGDEFPELAEVEAATMAWAKAAGLSTPPFHVLPIEHLQGIDTERLGSPRHAFVIERFDRRVDGRTHQEDFAQALGLQPAEKYGAPNASYDGLARLVLDACGPEQQGVFVERVAFVLASGNTDAHLKNWSFQWGHDHRPWLSPVYDQVSTIAWPRFGWTASGTPQLALRFGKTKSFASVDRARLDRFAERARGEAVAERFMAALERARGAWPDVRDGAPARMVEAVEAHWRRVPLLRQVGGPVDSNSGGP
jgi:serine/threonine-protein kinase HipA